MNFMGFEITRADGKTNWQNLRRLLYTVLIVWAFSVRLFHIDPFNLAALYVVAWLLDSVFFVAFCILIYHVIETAQKQRASNT